MKLQHAVPFSFLFVTMACDYRPSDDSAFKSKPSYAEHLVDDSTWVVEASGPGKLSVDELSRYAEYRAAALTKSKGYDFYVVMDPPGVASPNTSSKYIRMYRRVKLGGASRPSSVKPAWDTVPRR